MANEGFGQAMAYGAMAGFAVGIVNIISKSLTGTGWIDESVKIAMGMGGGQ